MKKSALLAILIAAAILSLRQAGDRKKYSIVGFYFKEKGLALEIVPDREVAKLKDKVRKRYKEALQSWKEQKDISKKEKVEFDKPEPPLPVTKTYKRGMSLDEANEEMKKLKLAAGMATTLLESWEDAYREEKEENLRKPEKPKGKHFSLITFNVNYALPGAEDSLKAILEADAGIVCLQETNEKWEKILKEKLKSKYEHMLFHNPNGGKSASGFAVLSKFEVKEISFAKSKVGWFPAWLLEADTPAGKFRILNLHLKPGGWRDGIPDAKDLEEMAETHVKEVEGFYPEKENEKPHIILGDLNESDGGKALKWLKEKGFTDALSEFDSKTPTWRWKVGALELKERLDHILYSKKILCCEAKVIEKGGSDHRPVFAVFEEKK